MCCIRDTFFFFVAEEVREIMASMGYRRFEDLVGQMQMLDQRAAIDHWKGKGLDLSLLLYNPPMPRRIARRPTESNLQAP